MNDIRRSILWVIFGFSLVLLWDQWQIHNGKPATFFPGSKPAVQATADKAPAKKAAAKKVAAKKPASKTAQKVAR